MSDQWNLSEVEQLQAKHSNRLEADDLPSPSTVVFAVSLFTLGGAMVVWAFLPVGLAANIGYFILIQVAFAALGAHLLSATLPQEIEQAMQANCVRLDGSTSKRRRSREERSRSKLRLALQPALLQSLIVANGVFFALLMVKAFFVGIERLNQVVNWLKLPWEVLFLGAAVLVGFSWLFAAYREALKQFVIRLKERNAEYEMRDLARLHDEFDEPQTTAKTH